jgi:hypothetical protein
MVEGGTANDKVKIEIGDAPLPSKVSDRDDFDVENSSKKTQPTIRAKDPEMNLIFLFGFAATILVGSFHYGAFKLVTVGYAISVYGTCYGLFIIMYDWDLSDQGIILLIE